MLADLAFFLLYNLHVSLNSIHRLCFSSRPTPFGSERLGWLTGTIVNKIVNRSIHLLPIRLSKTDKLYHAIFDFN